MRITNLLLLLFFSLTINAQEINIVPKPTSLKLGNGKFTISKQTVIVVANDADRKTADLFNEYLQQFYGFKLDIDKKEGKDYIKLVTKQFIKAPDKDGYTLNITKDGVIIEGDTGAGTFYGIQTLMQLLPLQKAASLAIPMVSINDAPRFSYRGMHLDVARHFFPPSFIKKYIDYLARHKMNYFHWHLTDDQGWRIEIKKYPNLQTVGAYRNGTIIGRFPGTANDNQRYGGYFTQEEVKDIVQYAADRHITVIPEIEMPGHASAAIASYPWLSCFPEEPTKIPGPSSELSKQQGAKVVQETWGVFNDVFCAGKDSTFTFLQNVIDEILPLFPSKYLHIGGDECPKSNWKRCPNCQKRIKDEKLKDEHELQSYFIQRMEKYLNNKGRTIIGWDEILEGGLAPNAIVMSWRGEKGGIEAAKQDHYVIMTPQSPVYFDHSQTATEDSVTIGGYNPIDKVYAYEPLPKELNTAEGKYILGAQANLWTEYIKNTAKVEYMLFPRISALSEVLWSTKEIRDWTAFENRIPWLYQLYQFWGANYSTAYYDIQPSLLPSKKGKGVTFSMQTKDKKGRLLYSIRNKHFAKNYTGPVTLTETAEITGLYYSKERLLDSITMDVKFNKATGKPINIKGTVSKNYPGDGPFTLVNGVQNTVGLNKGRQFMGFTTDMEAVINLGSTQKVANVIVHTLHQTGSWIYRPSSIEVYTSNDGKTYKSAGKTENFIKTTGNNGNMKVDFSAVNARYIKVIAKNRGLIPEGNPGSGSQSSMFIDEIEVN